MAHHPLSPSHAGLRGLRRLLAPALLGTCASLAAPLAFAAALTVPVDENFSDCTATRYTYTNQSVANGALTVDLALPEDYRCPNWTAVAGTTPGGRTYLARVVSSTVADVPVGDQALWLNEPGGAATATVTGLVAGRMYAFSAEAWIDDVPNAATVLEVSLGDKPVTLDMPAGSQAKQTVTGELCAKAKTAPLLLKEASPTTASPIVTRVRVTRSKSACQGFFNQLVTVTGLAAGGTLTVTNAAGEALAYPADGSELFPTPLASGAAYTTTISQQPAGQTCTVTSGNASGAMPAADVTVAITCVANAATAGGATPVPTLSQWALALLAGLVALAAAARARRRG